MGYPVEVRKYAYVSPPRAYGSLGPVGQVAVLPVSTTAHVVELDTMAFGLTYAAGSADGSQSPQAGIDKASGVMGNYITLYADGADVGVAFASNAFAVSGSNVVALATAGSVSALTTVTSSTGAPTTTPAGSSSSLFTDSTAGTFTTAMVGNLIQISGDATNPSNNGIFEVLAFISSSQIRISNNAAVTTTGLTWTVITGGAYTGTAGTCYRIPSGTSARFLTQIGRDLFLGYVGSGSGNLRLYQSNAAQMED